ncbi:hypothetical protein [Moraxella marmotae]|uniref:hypothetical protein n=1 Tax=Moraxella marmotae TaxID=3344520 RepID=UPI0035F2984A
MKILGLLFAAILGLSSLSAHAKTLAGYSFENYPAKIYQGKKAALQLGDWKMFRTRLRETHKDGQIDFAGNYMVSIWGCGAGCVTGAMIDKRTGKVYGLPIGEIESDDGVTPYDLSCYPLDNDSVAFYPNSRLFISRNCDQDEAIGNQAKQHITHFVFVWDEKTKTFKQIKKVKSTQTVFVE